MLLGRPIAALVDLQDRGIENAVGERFEPQCLEARLGVIGKDAPAAGQAVEVFQDHRRVVEPVAILELQHRNFSERVLLLQRISGILRRGGLDAHLVVEAKHAHRDPHLAAERRAWAGADGQHGNDTNLAATGERHGCSGISKSQAKRAAGAAASAQISQ